MKKIIIYSALLLIVVLIIAAFILFFYKKTELELKTEIEMEYLERKIDTTGWITRACLTSYHSLAPLSGTSLHSC